MLKIFSKITIAAMVVALGVSIPARYAPAMAAGETKYISEIKVGMDKTEEGAAKSLLDDGFTILKDDNGNNADLNKGAGSDDTMGRGQKVVYLGYKTTNDPTFAITDLAVMNMRGGYSIKDYEALMATRLKTEVLPFIDRFIVTLDEYRANLKSPFTANKARAEYMRSMLNKLQDDDTGGLLGDLLINKTKYELGDTEYAALSDEEKKQHADIATIIMQANGKSTLSMETLLTKATDTDEKSWIDRLEENTLDDLKEQLDEAGVDITEQDATLDRMYGDDANKLLEKWDTFSQALNEYDDKANELANIGENAFDEQVKAIEQYDENSQNKDKNGEALVASIEVQNDFVETTLDLELIAAKERMDEVDYDFDDGATLAEFFAQDASVFNGDGIRDLYPIVASLSAGQLAGLDFLSLQDLVTIATADATSYEANDLGNLEPVSIYEGVNREIFQKGKVALTNKALRAEAMKNDAVVDHPLSATTYILWGATALATAGMIASFAFASQLKDFATASVAAAKTAKSIYLAQLPSLTKDYVRITQTPGMEKVSFSAFNALEDQRVAKEIYNARLEGIYGSKVAKQIQDGKTSFEKVAANAATKSKIATYLGAAFTVAMAALAAVSIWSTIKELLDYYKVEYTPIPKYIVEETDITKTENGVTTVVRNDSAYYRVVECNRKPDADFYDVLQNYADLNGDVGKQWLALYYARQDGHAPIKADSLKVVTGTSTIPTGYSNLGIHNFETENAYNLTSKYYCYNDPNKGTYVYFNLDESAIKNASVTGSNFSTGSAVLFAGIGAVVGAGIAVAIMFVLNKKKETKVTQE